MNTSGRHTAGPNQRTKKMIKVLQANKSIRRDSCDFELQGAPENVCIFNEHDAVREMKAGNYDLVAVTADCMGVFKNATAGSTEKSNDVWEGLDLAYSQTNSRDVPWYNNEAIRIDSTAQRSTMIGDLMILDNGDVYAVASCGFDLIANVKTDQIFSH